MGVKECRGGWFVGGAKKLCVYVCVKKPCVYVVKSAEGGWFWSGRKKCAYICVVTIRVSMWLRVRRAVGFGAVAKNVRISGFLYTSCAYVDSLSLGVGFRRVRKICAYLFSVTHRLCLW